MNLFEISLSVILGAMLGTVVTQFISKQNLEAIYRELEIRPPIIVVDYAQLANEIKDDDSRESIIARNNLLQEKLNKYIEAGYFVMVPNGAVSIPSRYQITIGKQDVM